MRRPVLLSWRKERRLGDCSIFCPLSSMPHFLLVAYLVIPLYSEIAIVLTEDATRCEQRPDICVRHFLKCLVDSDRPYSRYVNSKNTNQLRIKSLSFQATFLIKLFKSVSPNQGKLRVVFMTNNDAYCVIVHNDSDEQISAMLYSTSVRLF